MSYQLDDYVHDEEKPSRWHAPVIWSVLIGVGFLLYEITAQPVLGVTLICAKFGWNDWRTAFWLRRRDPDRRSAKACFWLYLASGLLRTALMATLMMFAFAFASAIRHGGKPPPGGKDGGPPVVFIMAMLTALLSFGLTFITSFRAFFLAWRHGVKLWLDDVVHRSRKQNRWPPRDPHAPGTNKAPRVLLTLLITGLLPILLWGLFSLVLHREGRLGANAAPANQGGALPLMVGVFAVLLGGPLVLLWLADVLKRRLIADYPGECWRGDRAPDVSGSEERDQVSADYAS